MTVATSDGLRDLLDDPVLADILAGRRVGLLLLDYDGTLAPFTADRDEARPYPGVVDLLTRLPATCSGRFVVVSGRPAEAVARFLHPARPLEIWGCHGAERLTPGQPSRRGDVPPGQRQALDQALELARRMVGPEALEPKPVSLALHWRGLAEANRRALERAVGPAWQQLAQASGLALHAFDGGLELRLPGLDKGRAVQTLRREYPETSLVYLGDDLTDEDAFTALGPTDVGVLVRATARPSAARHRITPPEELLRFLSLWADAASPGKSQQGGFHDG